MRVLSLGFILSFVFFASTETQAAQYQPDYAKSQISFTGNHAGSDFKGRFKKWHATISFGSQDAEENKITATFDLKHAKTGDKLYDGTLTEKDWFYIKRYPKASFASTSVKEISPNLHRVIGELTIRNTTKTITFDLTFSQSNAKGVRIRGKFAIDRLAFGIGLDSDPEAEWVNQHIDVDLDIAARK